MKQVVEMSKIEPTIREIVGAGGVVRLTVTGKSMLPTLVEKRDSVLLKKPDRIKKGDIVLYQRKNGDYVLHRIVKKKKDCFCLCGDNQTMIECPVYAEQIFGLVSGIVRKGEVIPVTNIKYRIASFVWTNFIKLRPFILRNYVKLKG